jgi:hypothetical protein
MGKHPRMDRAVRDTATQSVDNSVATSMCWAITTHIPSCRGASGGAPIMVIHNPEPLRLGRVSS